MAACGGGGGDSALARVVPPELHITNNGRDIASDGAGLLPEEIDGSSTPVPLGKLNDDKNADGNAYYKLAEDEEASGTDNAAFEIIGDTAGAQILRFKGTDSGDLEVNGQLTLKIIRYNNKVDADAERSPQILDYIVNLINRDEVLTITNTDGEVIFSDGKGLLKENTAKGDELGTIDDSIDAAGNITYRLAAAAEGNNNALFLISDDGLKLVYNGEPLDYDTLTPAQRILTLRIERIRDGDTDNPQTLEYIINLQNLNDNDPVLTVEGGTIDGEKLPLLYDVSGTVGASDAQFTLAFEDIPLASNSLIIKVSTSGPDGVTLSQSDATQLSVEYQEGTNKIEKITIHSVGNFTANYFDALKTAFNDPQYGLSNYFSDATTDASFLGSGDTYTLTASTPFFKVASGTTGIIADFSGTDADNLQALIYSVSDETNFQINSDGELRFAEGANAPTYDSTIPANNIYAITVTVSDGTNTDTKELQIELTAAASPSSTASEAAPTATEAVPNKEPQKWEPSPFDNIFDDDPFGPIGGGGDGVL